MLRLRVTDLDSWLQYVEPALPQFELSTEEFLDRMRRKAPPTPEMLCGRAFGSWLEHAAEGDEVDDLLGTEVDGFRFRVGGDFALSLPPERERSVEKVYHTAVGPVLLRGRVDGRERDTVTDYKLTFSTFDAERYATSLQWQAYLDMLGGRRFRYLVFQARLTAPDVWIYDLHPLDLWAYPEMGSEVARRVGELAAFVAVHVPELIVTPETVRAP